MEAFREDFRRHYAAFEAYWKGIDAMQLQARMHPEFAFAPGVIQQWSALYRLVCAELDLLVLYAAQPEALGGERVWLETARTSGLIDHVHGVVDGTAYALDFSPVR